MYSIETAENKDVSNIGHDTKNVISKHELFRQINKMKLKQLMMTFDACETMCMNKIRYVWDIPSRSIEETRPALPFTALYNV